MKPGKFPHWFAGIVVWLVSAGAAENFDEALKRAALDYSTRLHAAGEELAQTREAISREKAPLLSELRATEARLGALERETTRLATAQEQSATEKRRLLHDLEETRKTGAYANTLAADALKAAADGLLPGEAEQAGERLRELTDQLAGGTAGTNGRAAIDSAEFLLARTEQALGGKVVAGHAVNATGNQAQAGRFAFVGPEVFFQPEGGGPAGIVRLREGMGQPVYFPQAAWPVAESTALFTGGLGSIPADPSGGKALRLQQAGGSLWQHIGKGGQVAYAIVAVGLVAVLLILSKLRDIAALRVDRSARVRSFLQSVSHGARAEAANALAGLERSTRELFAEGLAHLDGPAALLEERLEAVLLGQRLHFERRLPLLAVIATAAPLMGLLGTVVGMVKTFALITVFGTGNAARLSGGISEVLVATELGLAVAIPTLVIHGFVSHRINKDLALLDRQALEFATAAGTAQSGAVPVEAVR